MTKKAQCLLGPLALSQTKAAGIGSEKRPASQREPAKGKPRQ